ncbi:Relaxase/Mobilisation nuclease domain-containing protein [Ruminococcus flavefaciens]|uniref:Relaxase/Mobilisation nuclease domain-containing protein n=1 Tax=Ruminococcus flavefaciens TaxID=1265 RepID=A0A1H6LGJ9_RUMFL|nr:relaxase/mobilization nuclease domain-containing protein [Ruminococcus flavefaciens]SEH87641.1 Relaxase/Mobilisation nuclease domain-containing protein [Ruminococcus flavefaciens]
MDILTQKRVTNNGDGAGYFKHCINYVYQDKPEPGESLVQTRGYGVCDTNPRYTYQQMYALKQYYGRTGDNPVMHFVVSFDRNKVFDAITACNLTEMIANHLRARYQVITAVHMEDQGGSLFHAHLIVNSVDIYTGRLYHSGPYELQQLAMFIHNLTGNYCKSVIKYI